MAGTKQDTRVVEEFSPNDLAQCNICFEWKLAKSNFKTIQDKRPGRRLKYENRCSRCKKIHASLRKTINGETRFPSYAETREYIYLVENIAMLETAALNYANHQSRTSEERTKAHEAALRLLREIKAEQGERGGYVYLIREDGTNYVKIGYSVEPEARCGEMQTGNPRKLRLECKRSALPSQERKLHARFADANVLGEWFEASSDLLDSFDLPSDEPAKSIKK